MKTLKEVKKDLMNKALEKHKTIKEAAKALGVTSRTLSYHIANKKKVK